MSYQKCPVCEGRGVVPHGFYDINPLPSTTVAAPASESCRSCGGRGIVGMPDINTAPTPHLPSTPWQPLPPATTITWKAAQ